MYIVGIHIKRNKDYSPLSSQAVGSRTQKEASSMHHALLLNTEYTEGISMGESSLKRIPRKFNGMDIVDYNMEVLCYNVMALSVNV